MDETRTKVIELNLNDILPNRFQPRIKFNEDAIIELSESIKEHGVIQPIIVRPIGDKYEIIAGERRYKASVLAGKDTIPAIISDFNDKDSAEIALIENVQRRDLSPIEEAISYKKILDMDYLTQEQLAIKLGKSQSAVANKIRLLNLCDEVQEALMEDKISERHARSLLKLKDASKQREMLKRIIDERLTVRKVEEEIEKMNRFISDTVVEPESEKNPNAFSPNNPGFVDVDKIESQAKEIIPQNKPVDFNNLLMSQKPSQPSPVVSPTPTAPREEKPVVVPTESSQVSLTELSPKPVSNPQPLSSNPPSGGGTPKPPQTPKPMSGMPTTPIIEEPTIASTTMMDSASPLAGGPSMISQNSGYVPTSSFVFDKNGVVVEEKPLDMAALLATPSQREAQVMEDALKETEPTSFVSPAPAAPAEMPSIFSSTPEAATTVAPERVFPPLEPPKTVMPEPSVQPTIPSISVQPPQPEEPPVVTPSASPAVSVPSLDDIPSTPIVENALPDIFMNSHDSSKAEEPEPIEPPELVMPEVVEPAPVETKPEEKTDIQPIIITDYNKQYDPVLPPSSKPAEVVDFRKVINLIRDTGDQIEDWGYTIDLEEIDLENEYQVIFKINKG